MASSRRKAAAKRNKNRQKFLHKETRITCGNGVDEISQLPDDILASIISRLRAPEAAATSIISTRWRHLYTYSTRLNFSPSNEILTEEKFLNYINMINHTVDSHKGGRVLEEFRLHLPSFRRVDIERWLEFALGKEVQIIDIHINATDSFGMSPVFSSLISKYACLSLPGYKSLRELSLCAVDVCDEDVDLLLSNFIMLERLSIQYSDKLKNVRMVGDSGSRLKQLDVCSCGNTESIEIRNMINLVSLGFFQLPAQYTLLLNNLPKLIEFNSSDDGGNAIDRIFSLGVRDQFVKLKLSTDPSHIMTCDMDDNVLPKLKNVKHMEVEANMYSGCSAHQLVHLIKACPCLEILDIKFMWWACTLKGRGACGHSFGTKTPNHLKKAKLSEFLGCPSELKFASHIMEKAVELEKMIVEIGNDSRKIRRGARIRVWQHLRPILPKSVNFDIV